MAAKVAQIKCINKTDRFSPHERISHVGGYVTSAWKLTLDDAVEKIERGEWSFWVHVHGKSAWVVVAFSRNGRKYLRTGGDAEEDNNLLYLPECPV